MNELMNELLELYSISNKRVIEIGNEVERFKGKSRLSLNDKKTLQELKDNAEELNSLKEDLTNDIERIKTLEGKIKEREDVIAKSEDASLNLLHQDKLEELKKQEENLESELRTYYSKYLEFLEYLSNNDDNTEELAENNSKKNNSGKVAISIIALLAAAGLGFGASKIDFSKIGTRVNGANNKPETTDEQVVEANEKNEEKGLDYSKMTALYDESGNIYGYYDSETNTVVKPEVKEEAPVEITDELIAQVADEAAKEINANLEGYGMSAETMDEMIRWINGLPVKEATLEAQRAYMGEFLTLLANDTNAKEVFDYSKLFLKPNANKLAKTLVEVRRDVIDAIGTEKTEEVADELTELLTKMTKNVADKDGDKLNGVMSIERLESNASKFFIIQIFGSNYAKLDNTRNGVYVDKDGFEYYLRQDFEAMNTQTVINYEKDVNLGSAGDGCEYETLDYISYLGQATLIEAQELIANEYTLVK